MALLLPAFLGSVPAVASGCGSEGLLIDVSRSSILEGDKIYITIISITDVGFPEYEKITEIVP